MSDENMHFGALWDTLTYTWWWWWWGGGVKFGQENIQTAYLPSGSFYGWRQKKQDLVELAAFLAPAEDEFGALA